MRTSESGASVTGPSFDSSKNSSRRLLPSTTPAKKPRRWSGSVEALAARKRAGQPSKDAPAAEAKKEGRETAQPDAKLWLPPPGPASASVKSRLAVLDRNWNCDRAWQVPCWLASLLLHLLTVVVLGSFTIPVSRQPTVLSLLLSRGDLTAPADDQPVELALATTEAVQEPDPDENHREPGLDAEAFELPPLPQTAALTESSSSPRDQAEPEQPEQTTAAAGDLPGTAPPGQADVPGGALLSNVSDAENSDHDQVVERFIQYDIGKLLGDEGVKARQAFQSLGSDAMESLVRGLNRSASIHASCPVMVITYKIEAVLRENPDPSLLRYAVDNIGRGVPKSAPHRGRLKELAAQLRRMRPSPAGVNVTMLLAQLQGRARPAVVEALDLVLDRAPKFQDFEKVEIGWNCTRLLTHRDAGVRQAAHAALVALADGQDFGPAGDASPDERFAAAGKWSMHFDDHRYEAAAETIMSSGRHLEDSGKSGAARHYYQKIVREYPGTAAADEAAQRLQSPKSFAFR